MSLSVRPDPPRKTLMADAPMRLGTECPNCGEPWLRPSAVPGRYRCVYCLHRFELVSVCPNCGEHSTIVRMSSTAIVACNHCKGSMLRAL
jgi:ribosomal protein L37AE/L43A